MDDPIQPSRLEDLLIDLPTKTLTGTTDRLIRNLAYDSRQVQPGSLFVAIKGYHVDGHAFIAQAIERGAAAVVVDERYATSDTALPGCTLIRVPNSRLALVPLAAAFYRYPSRQLGVVGITGSKGKSTTTAMVSCALEGGGYTTGMISTVDFKVGRQQWPNQTRQSTPEAPDVQALLRRMVAAGCDYAVIEATSHALSQNWDRLGGCAFDVALFLNVTHEHLDYHGTIEQYRRDKTRLFAMLGHNQPAIAQTPTPTTKGQPVAIVNADDPYHHMFLEAAPASARQITFGLHTPADVSAHDIVATSSGSRMRVTSPWGDGTLNLALPGQFNIMNALAALSVALSQNIPLAQATMALSQVGGVRGRMERIDQGQPFDLIVDYAHNPDSFAQVMRMLRPLTHGRLIAVFGSAGERDREKRPIQGAIAATYCDLLILTDEDPRREDPEAILADIAAGIQHANRRAGNQYLLVPDRIEAIRMACASAQPGDLVLLLGKGHEGSIEYADGKHPWDEVAAARAALTDLEATGWK